MLQSLGNCTSAKVSVYVYFTCICMLANDATYQLDYKVVFAVGKLEWYYVVLVFEEDKEMRCSFTYLQKFDEIDLVCAVCRFIQTWRLLLLLAASDVVYEFFCIGSSVCLHMKKEKEEKPAFAHTNTHIRTLWGSVVPSYFKAYSHFSSFIRSIGLHLSLSLSRTQSLASFSVCCSLRKELQQAHNSWSLSSAFHFIALTWTCFALLDHKQGYHYNSMRLFWLHHRLPYIKLEYAPLLEQYHMILLM